MGESLTIATFNVNSLGMVGKRRPMFNYFHKKKFDIILLQETHSTKQVANYWKTEWGGGGG